jgi:hypothetical protein
VVLPGDAREDVLHLVGVDAVLLGVGRGEQAERRWGSDGGGGAVVGRRRDDEAGVAGVLELLDADRHRQVVGTRGDRIAGVAERLRPRRAHVLQAADRPVVDLQRPAQREAGEARAHRAEPEGVDVIEADAGRLQRRRRRVDEQVVGGAVPVFAERRAAHADDGDLVADPV